MNRTIMTDTPSPELSSRLHQVGASLISSSRMTSRPTMVEPTKPRRRRARFTIIGALILAVGGATAGTLTFAAKRTVNPIVGLVPMSFKFDEADSIQAVRIVTERSVLTLVSSNGTDALVEEHVDAETTAAAGGAETVRFGDTAVIVEGPSGSVDQPVPFVWSWRRLRGPVWIRFTVTTDVTREQAGESVARLVASTSTGNIRPIDGVQVVGSWASNEQTTLWIGSDQGGGFSSMSFAAPRALRSRAVRALRGPSSQYAFLDGFVYQRSLPGGQNVRPIRRREARIRSQDYDRQRAATLAPKDWSKIAVGVELASVSTLTTCVRARRSVACASGGLLSRLVDGRWFVARCSTAAGANGVGGKIISMSEFELPTNLVVHTVLQGAKTCWLTEPPKSTAELSVGSQTVARPLW